MRHPAGIASRFWGISCVCKRGSLSRLRLPGNQGILGWTLRFDTGVLRGLGKTTVLTHGLYMGYKPYALISTLGPVYPYMRYPDVPLYIPK